MPHPQIFDMVNLGTLDLEFLHLGIRNNGTFSEKEIERSELKRLGVGRTLDALASLKERNLIEIDSNGTFTVTDIARKIFWDKQIPLSLKILRLLDIKSFPLEKIATYLDEDEKKVFDEIEILRKQQLIMISPLRTEKGLEKMYEILEDGIAELEKIASSHDRPVKGRMELIRELIKQIEDLPIDEEVKQDILEKIRQIEDNLK